VMVRRAGPLTPRQCETGLALDSQNGCAPLGCCWLVSGGLGPPRFGCSFCGGGFSSESGCWDRWETGVDSACEEGELLLPPICAAWGRLAVPGPSGRCACLAGCTRLGRDCGLALRVVPPPEGLVGALQSAFVTVASIAEGCGLDSQLANAVRNQSLGDPPRSGSPSVGGCGRPLVVSTEGADCGPVDRGSVSEACEIGGLGTLEPWVCGTMCPRG